MSPLLRTEDVPLLPGLGAIRLRAGHAGAQRIVRWPYVAENRSFTPWIKGGELVFITGIGRHHSVDNLFELLYEGVAAKVAGLVILTGDAYIGRLPAALLKLADQQQLPLLEQPYSLPMVTVTEVIGRAIVQREQLAWRDAEIRAGSLLEKLQLRIGDGGARADFVAPWFAEHQPLLLQLAPTIDAWLRHGGNISAAAAALGSHRNSVRNRLDRLFRETGLDPAKPTDIYNLILAHVLMHEPTMTPECGDTP
ncbi:PucR family transcriptional regulator [Halopseudomonas aestusnigri]|uniref:PucR family transcriptional regulator n=1 Tax=Halopseudomonas aestusnigri TaxID=857252 RepID=UPI0028C1B674|nr:hypothetical protein YSKK_02900 [Halopseudomonas aestusnigri]